MTTYKINGKDYELQMTNTLDAFRAPILKVALVAADDDRIDVFAQNCANIDRGPEWGWHYAGGGKFWSEVSLDGDTVTPKPDAVKITSMEYAAKVVLESTVAAVETGCNFPSSRECENRADLVSEVSDWLGEQYKEMITGGIEELAESRLAEEEGAE